MQARTFLQRATLFSQTQRGMATATASIKDRFEAAYEQRAEQLSKSTKKT